MEFMFLKTWLHDRPYHGAHLLRSQLRSNVLLHLYTVGMHSHASQRTRSCFDVVRQVASIAVKEEGRNRKNKKKLKNSGRMGSSPNNGHLAICHLTQLMGMSDALQCCVTDPMKFGVGENRVVLPHVP